MLSLYKGEECTLQSPPKSHNFQLTTFSMPILLQLIFFFSLLIVCPPSSHHYRPRNSGLYPKRKAIQLIFLSLPVLGKSVGWPTQTPQRAAPPTPSSHKQQSLSHFMLLALSSFWFLEHYFSVNSFYLCKNKAEIVRSVSSSGITTM